MHLVTSLKQLHYNKIIQKQNKKQKIYKKPNKIDGNA